MNLLLASISHGRNTRFPSQTSRTPSDIGRSGRSIHGHSMVVTRVLINLTQYWTDHKSMRFDNMEYQTMCFKLWLARIFTCWATEIPIKYQDYTSWQLGAGPFLPPFFEFTRCGQAGLEELSGITDTPLRRIDYRNVWFSTTRVRAGRHTFLYRAVSTSSCASAMNVQISSIAQSTVRKW